MMHTVTYSARLRNSPKQVYGFLVDLLNDASWRDEVLRTDVLSGTPGEIGAQYRETLTWEGIRTPATLTVSEGVEGSHLVVVATEVGYRGVYEYWLEASPEGTDLSLTITVETYGVAALLEPFLWAMITRWFERGLQRLETAIGVA